MTTSTALSPNSSVATPGNSDVVLDRSEILRGASILFQQGDVVEVRILRTRCGTVAGYFDDPHKMVAAIHAADARYRPAGIYYTLNKLDAALLGRAYNRLKEYAELATADGNIQRRRWLPIDLDPVRPGGVSSSNEEHAAALQRAASIASDMASEWGAPIRADSGNGAHLLYRIDLPNDQDGQRFVAGALAELDRRYSDDVVKVDVSTANAARIWKAYGSVARKGDSIPGRSHRLSRILEVPLD